MRGGCTGGGGLEEILAQAGDIAVGTPPRTLLPNSPPASPQPPSCRPPLSPKYGGQSLGTPGLTEGAGVLFTAGAAGRL